MFRPCGTVMVDRTTTYITHFLKLPRTDCHADVNIQQSSSPFLYEKTVSSRFALRVMRVIANALSVRGPLTID